mmetsp:Transcript_103232/g.298632  ORF Transcript_103232/g.298632 Transcript_103232/m.298632 type:complete len:206 (+) Transcript_103232:423-1040(+)
MNAAPVLVCVARRGREVATFPVDASARLRPVEAVVADRQQRVARLRAVPQEARAQRVRARFGVIGVLLAAPPGEQRLARRGEAMRQGAVLDAVRAEQGGLRDALLRPVGLEHGPLLLRAWPWEPPSSKAAAALLRVSDAQQTLRWPISEEFGPPRLAETIRRPQGVPLPRRLFPTRGVEAGKLAAAAAAAIAVGGDLRSLVEEQP